MVNFVIYSPPFSENSGGIIALHVLADMIAKQGETCYIVSDHTFKENHAILLNNFSVKPKLDHYNTMVLYPEIINGNPFNSSFVTRWLLNTPGKIGGDGIYNDNDLVFKYYDYFKAPDESKVSGELRTFRLKLDIFNDRKLKKVQNCYIIKKGIGKELISHNINDILIHADLTDNQLADVFNKSAQFISYDSMTFYLQQAALCGCIPVVVPDKGISKEEFIEKAPVNRYGIAYGIDDIQHAKDTLHLVKDYLLEMEKESVNLVKNYIDICYNKMNIKK